MRVVIALERHGRVLNRTSRGITDRPRNDWGFLIAFVLAMSYNSAQRCQRNECAEYPTNSGADRSHQEVRFTVPVNANFPARAILSNVILTLIYCPSWLNWAFA